MRYQLSDHQMINLELRKCFGWTKAHVNWPSDICKSESSDPVETKHNQGLPNKPALLKEIRRGDIWRQRNYTYFPYIIPVILSIASTHWDLQYKTPLSFKVYTELKRVRRDTAFYRIPTISKWRFPFLTSHWLCSRTRQLTGVFVWNANDVYGLLQNGAAQPELPWCNQRIFATSGVLACLGVRSKRW